jgi:hypothetical protein
MVSNGFLAGFAELMLGTFVIGVFQRARRAGKPGGGPLRDEPTSDGIEGELISNTPTLRQLGKPGINGSPISRHGIVAATAT